MSKILEGLKKYFTKNNSNKDILEDLEYLNDIGPDALDYIRKVKENYGRTRVKKN